MRLVVKQNGRSVSELKFDKGPLYIGRQANSQVFLPDRTVSRQHAVIFSTQEGKWMVEDLDSANKTYLNDEAVHKAEIKSGDTLKVGDFSIEVSFASGAKAEKQINLEDTLTATARGPQIIERKLDTADAPPLRLPAKRATDFLDASATLAKAGNLDELLLSLLDVTSKQFGAYHNWCALRNTLSGPMTCHSGKHRDGKPLELTDIELNDKITEAVEKDHFLLFIFSRDLSKPEEGQIRSVVIAPIVSDTGCYGVIYIDNAIRDEHYNLGDLDYLMMLGIHTAAVVQKLSAPAG
jgi:pSer/pThr/pTyr-binding forkhead associated (FHA) protein